MGKIRIYTEVYGRETVKRGGQVHVFIPLIVSYRPFGGVFGVARIGGTEQHALEWPSSVAILKSPDGC